MLCAEPINRYGRSSPLTCPGCRATTQVRRGSPPRAAIHAGCGTGCCIGVPRRSTLPEIHRLGARTTGCGASRCGELRRSPQAPDQDVREVVRSVDPARASRRAGTRRTIGMPPGGARPPGGRRRPAGRARGRSASARRRSWRGTRVDNSIAVAPPSLPRPRASPARRMPRAAERMARLSSALRGCGSGRRVRRRGLPGSVRRVSRRVAPQIWTATGFSVPGPRTAPLPWTSELAPRFRAPEALAGGAHTADASVAAQLPHEGVNEAGLLPETTATNSWTPPHRARAGRRTHTRRPPEGLSAGPVVIPPASSVEPESDTHADGAHVATTHLVSTHSTLGSPQPRSAPPLLRQGGTPSRQSCRPGCSGCPIVR